MSLVDAELGLIDVHCHLDSDRFELPVAALLKEARHAGVLGCVMAGTTPESWRAQALIAAEHPGRVAQSYGIHPWVAAGYESKGIESLMSELEGQIQGASGLVAIGETGLDRSAHVTADSLPVQELSFRAHLALARRYELPVVLHVVRAHGPALAILRELGVPPAGGFVHSFSGSAEVARAYQSLGLYVSFSGGVCNPKSRRIREAAATLSAERILLETDAPDQSPAPYRGLVNRPARLALVAAEVAALRGESLAQLARVTRANTVTLLGRFWA